MIYGQLTERARKAAWRQRGFRDGASGWEPKPGELPEDVLKEYGSDWWVGFRRGREKRDADLAAAMIEGGSGGA